MSVSLDQEKMVLPYNFKRRDRVAKNQLRSLQAIHDRFARNFSSSLSTYLRTAVEVTLEETSQVSYAEFLAGMKDPTFYAALSMQPLEGSAAVEFEPEIIFPMIDRLLGGSGLPVASVRPMTEIEQSVGRTVMKLLLESLRESWRPVFAIEFGLAGTDVHPGLLQVVVPNEMVIHFQFRMRMRESIARMNMVLPLVVLEPISHVFNQESVTRKKVVRDGSLVAQLRQAPVSVSIETAETMFPMDSLLSLQVGDTLVLDQRQGWPVQLKVAGKNKLSARATGDVRKNAFAITGSYRKFREENNGSNSD